MPDEKGWTMRVSIRRQRDQQRNVRKDKKSKISTNKDGDKDDNEKIKEGYDGTMRSRSETIFRKRSAKFSATRHENDDNEDEGRIMLEM